MNKIDVEEAVDAFIDAANRLRLCDDVEIGFVLIDHMRSAPIRTYYALHVPANTYADHVKARLPEEA